MAAVAEAARQDAGGVARSSTEAGAEGRRDRPAEPRATLGERIFALPNLALGGLAVELVALAVVAGAALRGGETDPTGELEVAGTIAAPAQAQQWRGQRARGGDRPSDHLRVGRAADPPDRRVLRALVRRPRGFAREPEPDLGRHLPSDPEGRSDVAFTAAVDPANYPVVSVTAEPGDGDPERAGPEVLRLDSRD